MVLKLLFVAVISYLLGSLSFAIIVSKRMYGKDIRTFGSGNAGMTNVLRTFGKKAAALTITGDALKGTVSVLIARFLFAVDPSAPVATNSFSIFNVELHYTNNLALEIAIYTAVGFSLLGHLYPVFFQFKGGKGLSVIAGSMIAATPIKLLLGLGVFMVVAFSTKIVSLGAILGCSSYFFINLADIFITKTFSVPNFIASIIFPGAVIWAHRSNIKRLLNGTEYKFGQKK